jgi:hypothetical protein
MTQTTDSQRSLVAAAFRTAAQGIEAGIMPAPTSARLYVQYVSGTELLKIADHNDTKIKMEGDIAWVTLLLTEMGLRFELTIMTQDVTEAWLEMYKVHNEECIGRAIDEDAVDGRGTMPQAAGTTGNVNNGL